MNSWEICGNTLEYIDSTHHYIYDGVVLPSITQIMKIKFGNKYDGISKSVLKNAANNGTKIHEAIEKYCKDGIEEDYIEVHNFKFLMKRFGYRVIDNEVPVVLFDENDEPICAGRLDLVLQKDNKLILGDIKRTSTLDIEYLTYQLNLYRMAYMQCYEANITGLIGLHLREEKRKIVDIKINEKIALELVDEWRKDYEQ